MRSRLRPLAVAALALALAPALITCSGGVSDPAPGFGTLRVTMQATPSGRADEVWITFDRIEARHETMGWILVDDSVRAVDLESLADDLSETLALRVLPTGSYDGLRLHVRETAVMVGGAKLGLTVPAASADGIELDASFIV